MRRPPPGGRKTQGRPPGGPAARRRQRERPAEAVAAALDHGNTLCLPRGELFLGTDFLDRFFAGAEGGYAGRLAAAARSLRLSLVGVDLNGSAYPTFFDSSSDRLEGYFLVGRRNGPVSRLVERCGFFNAMLGMRRDPRFFSGIGEGLVREMEEMAGWARERGFAAVAVADDIAGNAGLFFPLDYFFEAVRPVYGRIAQVLKGKGLAAFFHSDGDTRKIIGPLIEAGYDCIHPVDAQAGLDLYSLRAEFGKKIAFMGHVDIAGWDEGRIGEEIDRAERSFREGGLILGSSCGISLETAGRLGSLYPGWR